MDELEAGALHDAAALNTRLTSVETKLNAVGDGRIRERSLGPQHMPAQLVERHFLEIDHVQQNYDNGYPGYNTVAGWQVVNTNAALGTGIPLTIVLGSTYDLTSDDIVGISLYGEVEISKTVDIGVGDSPGIITHLAIDTFNGAAWQRVVETEVFKSQRILAQASHAFTGCPTRFLLREGNLNAITMVEQVRLVVSVSHGVKTPRTLLQYANLGLLILRGGGF